MKENIHIYDNAIDESRAMDKKYIPIYRFWYNVYFVVYPLSKFFANHGISPNMITLLMLPSALLSAVLFSTGNIYLIIVGSILIHFFQIFDLCDGKVARATKHVTKYGREFDYLMHTVCHPIVYFSFFFLLRLLFVESNWGIIFVLIGAVLESTNRSLHNLSDAIIVKRAKEPNCNNKKNTHSTPLIILIYRNINMGIMSFPYFMCITPFLFLLNYFFFPNTPFLLYWILLHIFNNAFCLIRFFLNIYKKCWFEL